MDIIISMLVTFCILIFSVFKGIFVGYPLLLGFFLLSSHGEEDLYLKILLKCPLISAIGIPNPYYIMIEKEKE